MYLDIDFQPRHDIIDTSVVLYISGLKNTWLFFEIFPIKIHTLLHPFEQINEALLLLRGISKIWILNVETASSGVKKY